MKATEQKEAIEMKMMPRSLSLFDDLTENWFADPFFTMERIPAMKTDIQEKEGQYLLNIELPGMKKEDIHLELEDGYLTVRAEHSHASDDQDDQGNIIRRERVSGSCSRSFYVGEEVTEQDIKAKYDNGELKIVLPKKQPAPQVETRDRKSVV